MLLQDKLQKLSQEGNALLATNFYNFETLSGCYKPQKQKINPMILQLSKSPHSIFRTGRCRYHGT